MFDKWADYSVYGPSDPEIIYWQKIPPAKWSEPAGETMKPVEKQI